MMANYGQPRRGRIIHDNARITSHKICVPSKKQDVLQGVSAASYEQYSVYSVTMLSMNSNQDLE